VNAEPGRCATCKHWEAHDPEWQAAPGNPLRFPLGGTCSVIGERFVIGDAAWKDGAVEECSTAADFGCIMHEAKGT
jgi:hypothetical protein